MDLSEGKQRFIQSWGVLGSQWGINRTMAQVHALLLISPKALSCEDLMAQLQISRGNASMNIRALIDWGLAYKKLIPGNRKEHFLAEKDMWTIVRQVVIHRKTKEFDPMLELMDDICNVQGKCIDSNEFCRVMNDIRTFSGQVDKSLDILVKGKSNWVLKTFLNLTPPAPTNKENKQ